MYDLFTPAKNPFDRATLNCLSDQHAYDSLLELAISQLAEADQIIQRAVAAESSCHFLIIGPDGSGRTSVANCLLGRYARLRGIPWHRLLVPSETLWPPQEVLPDAPIKAYRQWLEDLVNTMRRTKLRPPRELEKEIVDLAASGAAMTSERIAGVLYEVVAHLGAQLEPAGLALKIERVPNAEYASVSRKAFSGVRAMCVMTTSDYSELGGQVLRDRAKKFEFVDLVIQLGHLTGSDAYRILEAIWKTSCTAEFPFPRAPIVAWQDQKLDSIRRILRVMKVELDLRLSRARRETDGGTVTAESLVLGETELADDLGVLSSEL